MWCMELFLTWQTIKNNLENLTLEGDSPVLIVCLVFWDFLSSVYWKLGANMEGTNLQI